MFDYKYFLTKKIEMYFTQVISDMGQRTQFLKKCDDDDKMYFRFHIYIYMYICIILIISIRFYKS